MRRRFHLTISGCLGPCPLAKVVLLQLRDRAVWFHSINHAGDVDLIYDYVEQVLRGEIDVMEMPEALACRRFERYVNDVPASGRPD